MKNRFWGGMLVGILLCSLLFGMVACDLGADENSLTERGEQSLNLEGTLSEQLEKLGYDDKVATLATLLEYYYFEDVDSEQLAEGIYAGLVNSVGDIYTTYYTAEEYKEFNESSTGKYAGLGSTVTTNAEGNVELVKPFKGGPAYKAGLLPGDILVAIDGVDAYGMDLTEAVSLIKGEAGTSVHLKIYRAGEPDYIEVDVVREFVEVPTIEHQMLENKVGYIYVMEFDEVTEEQFMNAVDALEDQGMESLIVDLRDNPGGMLTTVCSMLSRILPKDKLLIYTEDKQGEKQEYFSDSKKTVEVPIAVLINGNSASASEVFAGALQDYDKAVLIGTQSFGKGIVQSIIPLKDGSAMKVTVSKYFTPNGRNIHLTGLTPDILVELDEELKGMASIPIEEDNQIQAAVDYLTK